MKTAAAVPKRRRVVKPADDRRRELLDAAASVFARRGFQGASVAEICDAAGVAKGTFYVYFDSKEHLLGALKQRHADDMLRITTAYLERVGSDDFWALADAMVQAIIDKELENTDMVQVLCQEGFGSASDVFAVAARTMRDMVARGITTGVDAGVFSCADPVMTATLLINAVRGTVETTVLYERRVNRRRLIASAQELVRKTLAPASSS